MTILASLEFVEDCIQLYALEGCPDPGISRTCRTLMLCNVLLESNKALLRGSKVDAQEAVRIALSYHLPIRHCVLHRERSVLFLPEARDIWSKLKHARRLPNTYSQLVTGIIGELELPLHYTSFVEV